MNENTVLDTKTAAEIREAIENRKFADRKDVVNASAKTPEEWGKQAEAEIAAANTNAEETLPPSEELGADAEAKLPSGVLRSMSESFKRQYAGRCWLQNGPGK